jgi:hypothetical protein
LALRKPRSRSKKSETPKRIKNMSRSFDQPELRFLN